MGQPWQFTNYCRFPGAIMHNDHELIEKEGGIAIKHTVTVKGLLSFLWVRLVAKKIAANIPKQTDNLIALAKQQ